MKKKVDSSSCRRYGDFIFGRLQQRLDNSKKNYQMTILRFRGIKVLKRKKKTEVAEVTEESVDAEIQSVLYVNRIAK